MNTHTHTHTHSSRTLSTKMIAGWRAAMAANAAETRAKNGISDIMQGKGNKLPSEKHTKASKLAERVTWSSRSRTGRSKTKTHSRRSRSSTPATSSGDESEESDDSDDTSRATSSGEDSEDSQLSTESSSFSADVRSLRTSLNMLNGMISELGAFGSQLHEVMPTLTALTASSRVMQSSGENQSVKVTGPTYEEWQKHCLQEALRLRASDENNQSPTTNTDAPSTSSTMTRSVQEAARLLREATGSGAEQAQASQQELGSLLKSCIQAASRTGIPTTEDGGTATSSKRSSSSTTSAPKRSARAGSSASRTRTRCVSPDEDANQHPSTQEL